MRSGSAACCSWQSRSSLALGLALGGSSSLTRAGELPPAFLAALCFVFSHMFNVLRLQPYVWRAVRAGWLRPGSRRRLSRRAGPARPPPARSPSLPPSPPPSPQGPAGCAPGRRVRGWGGGRERWGGGGGGAACPPPVPPSGPSRLTAAGLLAPRLLGEPARLPGDRLVRPGPRWPGLGDSPAAGR